MSGRPALRAQLMDVPVHLVSAEVLGLGACSRVVAVAANPRVAAKVFEAPDARLEERLRAMMASPPRDPLVVQGRVSVAWPLDLVVDESGRVVGYVAARVIGGRPLTAILGAATRPTPVAGWSDAHQRRAALVLAGAFRCVHEAGHVLGRVDPSRVFWAQDGTVTLLATDRFQIGDASRRGVHPCVGEATDVLAPELDGGPPGRFRLTPAQDAHALAVLVGSLLDRRELRSPGVADLLRRCFEEGAARPDQRPSASDWERVLAADSEAASPAVARPAWIGAGAPRSADPSPSPGVRASLGRPDAVAPPRPAEPLSVSPETASTEDPQRREGLQEALPSAATASRLAGDRHALPPVRRVAPRIELSAEAVGPQHATLSELLASRAFRRGTAVLGALLLVGILMAAVRDRDGAVGGHRSSASDDPLGRLPCVAAVVVDDEGRLLVRPFLRWMPNGNLTDPWRRLREDGRRRDVAAVVDAALAADPPSVPVKWYAPGIGPWSEPCMAVGLGSSGEDCARVEGLATDCRPAGLESSWDEPHLAIDDDRPLDRPQRVSGATSDELARWAAEVMRRKNPAWPPAESAPTECVSHAWEASDERQTLYFVSCSAPAESTTRDAEHVGWLVVREDRSKAWRLAWFTGLVHPTDAGAILRTPFAQFRAMGWSCLAVWTEDERGHQIHELLVDKGDDVSSLWTLVLRECAP